MESRINEVFTLDNGYKFMIIDQGVYNMKNYYLSSKVDDNGNLTDEFAILEEIVDNGVVTINSLKDERMAKALTEYFTIRNMKD